jgi:LPS O-antigen subunit length determinant protein (WzzB/FepE family)
LNRDQKVYNEEIEYLQSETYKMEIALPYTEEIERKQTKINILEYKLDNFDTPCGSRKQSEKSDSFESPDGCDRYRYQTVRYLSTIFF